MIRRLVDFALKNPELSGQFKSYILEVARKLKH